MTDLANLIGGSLTIAWLFLIIGFCWAVYILGRRQPEQ